MDALTKGHRARRLADNHDTRVSRLVHDRSCFQKEAGALAGSARRDPIILVGDRLGNVGLGYEGTIPVTMDEMIHHTAAVVRGSTRALVVGDMPFMSYQALDSEAIRNAGRFLKEAGCQAVKLEGGRTVAPLVRKLVGYGIPVMGHIGLTPQSVNQLGGYRVQGRTSEAPRELIADA